MQILTLLAALIYLRSNKGRRLKTLAYGLQYNFFIYPYLTPKSLGDVGLTILYCIHAEFFLLNLAFENAVIFILTREAASYINPNPSP
jgi:hypothetical protein